ncbi:MAG: small basic protein (TIGR04137 family) [Phycisphaerales bacterium]|jgi:small basic protein (TIGR04137 family)
MSINASLKMKGGLAGKRSVMTRAERMKVLKDDKKFDLKKSSILGLPKTKSGE